MLRQLFDLIYLFPCTLCLLRMYNSSSSPPGLGNLKVDSVQLTLLSHWAARFSCRYIGPLAREDFSLQCVDVSLGKFSMNPCSREER